MHTGLETYKVPKQLVGQAADGGEAIPRRLLPIFRDREELPGAADLGGKIKNALRQSRHLVVICSPNSAASKWVNEEVRLYKAMGREDRVLCLIVDGEPNASEQPDTGSRECFPPAVRYRVNSDGELTDERAEPIAADAREGKDGRARAKLKVLAGILNVGYDDLRQREKQRRFWQRVRLAGGLAALTLLAATGYLAVSDAGLGVPGGGGIRTFLDGHAASVLRPVRSQAEISDAAAALRHDLLGALRRGRESNGAIVANLKPNAKRELEVWAHSQALTAVLSLPEHPAQPNLQRDLREFAVGLDAPFTSHTTVEVKGVRYGWVSHPGETQTQAEPALWTTAALTKALGRRGLLTGRERQRQLEHLAYAQGALKIYHPARTGGWNMFARQKIVTRHNTYTTALALLVLLETRKARLPWEGSTKRRDALLKDTARWLVAAYDPRGPGWHIVGETGTEVPDGLTLQIYSELLRAERDAGVKLSGAILADIPGYLAKTADRGPAFPTASGEFAATVTDPYGHVSTRREAIGFLWYPWAIYAATAWLARAERVDTPPEQRVRVRRALGHLVVDIGNEVVDKAASKFTFEAAETLYGVSSVTR